MRTLYCLGIVCISVGLTSCEAIEQMHQHWVAENCVTSAAYNKGLTDGLTPGVLPDRNYASRCPINNNQLNTAYLNGFAKGMSSRPLTINANVNTGSSWNTNTMKKVEPADPFSRGTHFSFHSSSRNTESSQSSVHQTGFSQSPVQKSDMSQSPIQQRDPSQSPVQDSRWSW